MKKRYALRFTPELVGQPLVSKMVRAFDVDVNILNADITSGRNGKLIVELSGASASLGEAVAWLEEVGVNVSEIVKELVFNQEDCVSCGSCTAVCFSEALSLHDWQLTYDASKCTVCGLCVKACPLRLFALSTEREVP